MQGKSLKEGFINSVESSSQFSERSLRKYIYPPISRPNYLSLSQTHAKGRIEVKERDIEMPSHTTQPLSCQLCSIPFTIGRVRTIHEPLSSSLDATTSSPYHLRDGSSSRCSRDSSSSGCQNIIVEKPHDVHAESRLQHLAGEGCTFEGGYSGWRIGVREMRGMRGVRFVLPKKRGAVDDEESGDEGECEEGSRFFVSEEIEGPFLEGENVYVKLPEERYGVTSFTPRNFPPISVAPDSIGIPIHSTCFSIFSRISLQQLGRIDLDGFAALWYRKACGGCGFQGLNHDPVIGDLKERFWVHRVGTEYLAANPVVIPGFELAMQGVYGQGARGDGVFGTRDSYGIAAGSGGKTKLNLKLKGRMGNSGKVFRRHRNSTDPFFVLPPELKNKILADLSPSEITAIRLSSRSFRQLPKQIFKSFIAEEMPWFWEIDDIRREVEEAYKEAFRDQLADLGVGFDSEGLAMLEGVMPSEWLRFVKERMEGKAMDANWLEVFKQLRVMEKGCLGLRNRKRIWGLAGEVVGMIERMREGLEKEAGGFEIVKEEMRVKGKGSVGRDFWSCPRCENVQIELEEEDSEEDEEEDSDEESFEGESSGGETSVEESSEDACSSGEDSD
ncbi:hypothetical protein ONS96_009312 [Cadophora gregata f. sp. sojae]|nr:hypothetical protein ONS96_009312 [Cadophora gregata f. sp. sojae]